MVEEHQCGKIYQDAKSMSEAILEYKSNKRLLAQSKENAARLFEMNFKKDQVYGEYCDYIEHIADMKK